MPTREHVHIPHIPKLKVKMTSRRTLCGLWELIVAQVATNRVFAHFLSYMWNCVPEAGAETSNDIWEILWDSITFPCPWYLLLAQVLVYNANTHALANCAIHMLLFGVARHGIDVFSGICYLPPLLYGACYVHDIDQYGWSSMEFPLLRKIIISMGKCNKDITPVC